MKTTKGLHMGCNDDDNHTPPHPPLELAAAAVQSDLELVISFAFGGKDAVENVVDTLILCLPSSLGVISSSLSSSLSSVAGIDAAANHRAANHRAANR